jgi:probable F420-dependent oxidoreductase
MEYWFGYFHEGHEQVCEIARAAEAMGFAGFAVPDHVAIPRGYASMHPSGRRPFEHDTPFLDPLITLATVAAVTTRLRLLTYVYVLPLREPFSVAKQVGTLAMQSGYRMVLGVGSGWMVEEIALLGQEARDRGRRTDEMIAIMRDFWQDGLASAQGDFYRFETAGEFPVPQGPIPIWIGGKSKRALRCAARNDGWAGMDYTMEEIPRLLATLNTERQRYRDTHGDTGSSFYRFVIPQAPPSLDIYHRLEDWGIDGTMALPWPINDDRYASLAAKLDAMQAFADRFLHA